MAYRMRATAALLACGVGLFAGCVGTGKGGPVSVGGKAVAAEDVSPDDARTIVQSFADGYVVASIQSFDELRASTTRPAVARWALAQKVATATAAYTNATAPNPFLACVDQVILASLKRIAIERHWMSALLGEEGADVLEAARRSEQAAWEMAGRTLSKAQLDDLDGVIRTWVKDNPDQYYVGWVRLTDIAAARSRGKGGPAVKMPTSLLGLLFIDPLANLDPVAQEMRNYRNLTERLTYLLLRMPQVYSWQVQFTLQEVLSDEHPQSVVSATTRFAEATDRFATATAGYPKAFGQTMQDSIANLDQLIAKERSAAIGQVGDEVAAQRAGLMADLDAQQGKMRQLVGDARSAVGDIERSITVARTGASETIRQTDEATAALVDRVRNATILVIAVACVVPALTLLVYRRVAAPKSKLRG